MGGFELSASTIVDDEALLCELHRIFSHAALRSWPPEIISPSGSRSWRQLKVLPPWIVDSYMLAVNIFPELFGSREMPPEFGDFTRKSSVAEYRERMDPAALLNSSLFKGIKIIEVAELFERLVTMEADTREKSLNYVLQILDQLPINFVRYKVVPTVSHLLLHVFCNNMGLSVEGVRLVIMAASKLPESEVSQAVEPILRTFFGKTDRGLRLTLLNLLSSIFAALDPRIVQEIVYPAMISGFTDPTPELREATLKASLLLSSKLTSRQLNGELLRFYARLQTDAEPGIRVNTIVCLGRIAALLETSTCHKVLIPAYVKALRDPFSPSRIAALSAIGVTIDFLAEEEIGRTLVPALGPLLVDPNKEARTASFKVLEQLKRVLEEYAALGMGFEKDSPRTASLDEEEPQFQMSNLPSFAKQWGITTLADRLMNATLGGDHNMSNDSKPTDTGKGQGISEGWDTHDSELLDLDIPDPSFAASVSPDSTVAFVDEDNPWKGEPTLCTESFTTSKATTDHNGQKTNSKSMVLSRQKVRLLSDL